MRVKIISALVFAILLPHGSFAAMIVPTTKIEITVESGSQDGEFQFFIQDNFPEMDFFRDFSLRTFEGSARMETFVNSFGPNSYLLTELVPDGWLLESVVCVSDDPGTYGSLIENGVLLSTKAFTSISCIFKHKKQTGKTPILFVPGTLGTEIYFKEDLIWPDIERMIISNNDRFLDSLSFSDDGLAINTDLSIGNVLLNPSNRFDYTQSLKQTFADLGYQEGKDFFLFPYDWRDDIAKNANIFLKQKIDYLLTVTASEQLDVIAHSQGGLLVKKLLLDRPEYRSRIRKLALLGVPHLGSPKSAKALLYGDDLGVSFGLLGLDPQEIKRISKNLPAIYQMLPSQEYFRHNSGYWGTYEDPWFADPETVFYGYGTTREKLKADGYNGVLLDSAEAFHAVELDDFSFSAGSVGPEVYSLIGCRAPTLKSMLVRKFGPDRFNYGPGDGTVPMSSASHARGTENYFVLTEKDFHGIMPSVPDISNLIANLFTGSNLPVEKISKDDTDCGLAGKLVSVHSPADLHIYDQSGNHTGPGQGAVFDYGIPGVVYDISGDEKFAFLPNGPLYRLVMKGTGSGWFTFDSELVEQGVSVGLSHYGPIEIGVGDVAETLLVPENDQTLLFPGKPALLPSAMLTESQLKDNLPPQTTAIFSGAQIAEGKYASPVGLDLTAEDYPSGNRSSGLSEIRFSLDGGTWEIWRGKTISIEPPGRHQVKFFSVDNIGNTERVQVLDVEINQVPLRQSSGGPSPAEGLLGQEPPRPPPLVLGAVAPPFRHDPGQLIIYLGYPTVYEVTAFGKRPFVSARQFLDEGHNFDQVHQAWPGDDEWGLAMPRAW